MKKNKKKEPVAKTEKEPVAKIEKQPVGKIEKQPVGKIEKQPVAKIEKEPERERKFKYNAERDKPTPTHHDIANRACNLECLTKKVVEKDPDWFTGLVKIVLVKPSRWEYFQRILWAGLIGLAYIMMGSVSSMVFYFALAKELPAAEGLHVLLCTAGFQLLIPAGILMISDLNGPSAPMQTLCRRANHVLLQVSGLIFGLIGSIAILFYGKKDAVTEIITAHFFFGIITCTILILGALFGPFLIFILDPNFCSDYFGPLHLTLGITGFLASSVCLITGVLRPSFVKWLPIPEILYFLISFCVIYTFVIFLTPVIRCLSCKTREED